MSSLLEKLDKAGQIGMFDAILYEKLKKATFSKTLLKILPRQLTQAIH